MQAKQVKYEDDGNTEGLTHAQRAVKQWNEHVKSNNSVIVSCFQVRIVCVGMSVALWVGWGWGLCVGVCDWGCVGGVWGV